MAHMEDISILCDIINIIKAVVQLATVGNTSTPPQLNTRQSELVAERASDALPVHEELKNKANLQESKIKGLQAQGPWGGNGGGEFTDGLGTSIKRIKLKFDTEPRPCIWFIEVQYDVLGKSFVARHGDKSHGSNTEVIKINGPSEYITQIEGWYGIVPVYCGGEVVGLTSLTIRTNENTHGPFGGEGETKFKSSEGQIIGFYGRSGMVIDQIGCFIAPAES